jgi:hypothetical protein
MDRSINGSRSGLFLTGESSRFSIAACGASASAAHERSLAMRWLLVLVATCAVFSTGVTWAAEQQNVTLVVSGAY